MGVLDVVKPGVLTGSETKKLLLTLKRIILQYQLLML